MPPCRLVPVLGLLTLLVGCAEATPIGGGEGGVTTSGGDGGTGGTGEGSCVGKNNGDPCGDPDQLDCDQSVCASGSCLPVLLPENTPCGDPTEDTCTSPDTCNGEGICDSHDSPAGIPCGSTSATACNLSDVCDGSGACSENFAQLGTPCGDDGDSECSAPDACNGSGMCADNHAQDGIDCNDCAAGPGLCTVCASGVCGSLCLPGSLNTNLVGNSGLDGVMFDVTAQTNLQIKTLDTNLIGGMHNVQIYYRAGSHVGFENSPAGWLLLGNATVMSAGQNTATPIPIPINLQLTAGLTFSFWVTTDGTTLRYTVGTTLGAIAASDGKLQIKEGTGLSWPLGGDTYTSRIFSGIVHYNDCP